MTPASEFLKAVEALVEEFPQASAIMMPVPDIAKLLAMCEVYAQALEIYARQLGPASKALAKADEIARGVE